VRYGNELKVGVSIVLAIVVFYVGLRFFQDLPIFRGTFNLETEFEQANGLVAGNEVRVRGVTVGKVKEVGINPENNQVRVLFHIDNSINVPVDSYTEIDGFEAFGVIRVSLHLGSPNGPMLTEGDFVPSHAKADILGAITDRAPALITQVDSVLVSLDGTLGEARTLLAEPSSDLRTTLVTARQTMNTLNELLREEKVRVDRVLAGAEELTGTLSEFARQRGSAKLPADFPGSRHA
jgi:phospholipid/cholesterol/gamma-HCH transport system substrate-binding protein